MKTISRIALLTVLFSVSAPLFSEDTPKASPTTATAPSILSKFMGLPQTILSAIFIKTPQTISDYSIGYVLDKATKNISYLQNGRIAQHQKKIGFVLVYLTGLALAYKAYTMMGTEDTTNENLFDYVDEDNNSTNTKRL